MGNSASACLVMGSYIQGLVVLTVDGFQPQAYQATLLFWGVALMLAMFNTVLASWLPTFERAFLVLHISGFFAMLIPLVIKAPHGTPQDVFETFQNQGMWPSQGLSFFVGMIGNAFSFAGSDAAYHVCSLTTREMKC